MTPLERRYKQNEIAKLDRYIADFNKLKTEHLKALESEMTHLEGLVSQMSLVDTIQEKGQNAYGTWVIVKDKNVYYQFNRVGESSKLVYIARNGTDTWASIEKFNKDFRLATPSEVKQHLEFLAQKGLDALVKKHKPLIKPAPKWPFTVPPVRIKGDLISFVESINKFKIPFDPMKCDFYMVTCRGLRGAKVRHKTYEEAEQVAIDLAKSENHETWIVGVVASVKPVTETVIKTTVKKR